MSDDLSDFLQDPWRDPTDTRYDGVRGELDDWIPENFHREFHATRSHLQFYSHDDLLKFVTEVRDYWEGVNATISVPLEIQQEIFTLVYFQEAMRLGKDVSEEAGLAFLTDSNLANHVTKGTNYSNHQSKIASNPRGKVSGDGETINEIIGKLALSNEHPEESAKELWPHFYSKLEELELEPKLFDSDSDPAKWTCKYDFNGGHKSITFGQFANVVSANRSGKKSG